MNDFTNLTKLVAIAIMGGVVKSLFGQPKPPITNVYQDINSKNDEKETN